MNQSPFYAYVWINLAKTNGYSEATQVLDEVTTMLSQDEITNANYILVICLASFYEECE